MLKRLWPGIVFILTGRLPKNIQNATEEFFEKFNAIAIRDYREKGVEMSNAGLKLHSTMYSYLSSRYHKHYAESITAVDPGHSLPEEFYDNLRKGYIPPFEP